MFDLQVMFKEGNKHIIKIDQVQYVNKSIQESSEISSLIEDFSIITFENS